MTETALIFNLGKSQAYYKGTSYLEVLTFDSYYAYFNVSHLRKPRKSVFGYFKTKKMSLATKFEGG